MAQLKRAWDVNVGKGERKSLFLLRLLVIKEVENAAW